DAPATPLVVPNDQFTCPVCTASQALLAEPVTWASLADADGGLCNVHAWHADVRVLCSLFTRQITAIDKRASALAASTENRGWLRAAVRELTQAPVRNEPEPLPSRCVVCRRVGALEVAMAADPQLKPLCLPHLRRAITQRGVSALEAMKPIWRELDYLLGEYLRKEDYRFRGEPRGQEQKSPRWVVALISGAPGIR
ncbi:MAG TPA: hypothetical protein VKX96_16190, partial [Chloroflexota bacterium]|nr:hypothetical protein [Chloroflexota bacterium]